MHSTISSPKQVPNKGVDTPVVVQHQMSMVADAPQLRHFPTNTNEKGRWSQTVIDRVIHEAGRYQDEDETNKARVDAKNGLEDCCGTMRNAAIEEQRGFKCEAGGKEKPEKAMQNAGNWLDKISWQRTMSFKPNTGNWTEQTG